MRIAAIDIGTNTILMVIADVDRSGAIRVLRDEHVIARLGKGVDERRSILPETFERASACLAEFKRIADEARAERIVACGTSALRDASNRSEFIRSIHSKLGIEITVLSGGEEAELTFIGAVSEFLDPRKEQDFAVLDIGGGSTELTLGKNTNVLSGQSLDVGSVRLTERILKTSPPAAESLVRATEEVRRVLGVLGKVHDSTYAIGVAGTLTTLAAIDLQLPVYDRTKVSGHLLTFETVQRIYDSFRTKTLDEIKQVPQVLPERADILLAGMLILLEAMKRLRLRKIAVSDRGLRFGMLMREAGSKR